MIIQVGSSFGKVFQYGNINEITIKENEDGFGLEVVVKRENGYENKFGISGTRSVFRIDRQIFFTSDE